MSMNLACNVFTIPQIPTYYSYLIYSASSPSGLPDGGWKGVAYRLRMYWRQQFQEEFNARPGKEEQAWISAYYDDLNERFDAAIKEALEQGKTPDFWVI